MALNFPNSPADGDLATLNGTTFKYNSAKNLWDPVTEELTTTSDNPPGSPSNGQTWFDTTTGTLYVYYDDGTSSQWVGVTGPGGENAPSGSSSGSSSVGGSGTTTYATIAELPLTGNAAGDQAFVSGNNRLYLWNGNGWYNIALINTAPTITGGGAGSYALATDGTPTVITLTAVDPEELPITWTYSVTSGSLTNGGGVTATVTQADNVFTITPTTTEAYAGTFSLTFTASDGVNLATDTNSFSLEFITVVQDSKYTSFLLKTDPSLSDNQVDASTWTQSITESGGVTSTAVTPYHPKGYSSYFDGTGDFLEGPAVDLLGSGAFTVECWAYISSTNATYTDAFLAQYQTNNKFIFGVKSDVVRVWMSATEVLVGTTNIVGGWHHFSLVRDASNNCQVYIDGIAEGSSFSNSTDFSTSLENFEIGSWNYGANSSLHGYIKDLRVVKGTAVYTSTFTPPTEPLTAITGTELLTCHLPYIADGSSNNYSITKHGDISTKPFGPYDHLTYDSATDGGSVYFDGNGDSISIPTNIGVNFNSNTDFTIECWIYKTGSFKNYDSVWSKYDTGGDGSGPWLHINNSGNILFGTTGLNGQTSTQTLKLNTWHHIAVVRDNPTIKVYLDGVATSISLTYTNSIGGNVHPFLIGKINGYSRDFEGYISDIRINNGTAVYTTDFTPPDEPLTAISGTTLLTCTNKNSIWDAAGGTALINIGDPTVSTNHYKWYNSLYVDGIDDSVYFTLPDVLQTMGRTGTECTIEAWVWLVTAPASGSYGTAIYSQGTQGSSGGSNVVSFEIQENQTVRALINGSYSSLTGVPISTGTVSTGQWTHLALVLYNQTWTIYINGIADGTGTGSYPSGTTHTTGYIGRVFYGANRTAQMFIEDLRISPTHARYTANFTPPTGSFEG